MVAEELRRRHGLPRLREKYQGLTGEGRIQGRRVLLLLPMTFMNSSGKSVGEALQQLGVSEPTYHRWRNQYGGMKAAEAKRLKQLEQENGRLKKLVAEQALDIQILKEVSSGNW